jgi:hypothetical protein
MRGSFRDFEILGPNRQLTLCEVIVKLAFSPGFLCGVRNRSIDTRDLVGKGPPAVVPRAH